MHVNEEGRGLSRDEVGARARLSSAPLRQGTWLSPTPDAQISAPDRCARDIKRDRGRLRPWASWLCAGLLLVQTCIPARADSLLTRALGLGGDSGQLAKFEFRLRDDFPVTSVAWSPDGRFIATASTQSNLLHIWDVQRRQVVHEFKLAASQPHFGDLSWSPDGRYLTTCGGDSSLRVYESATWTLAKQIGAFGSGICRARPAFSSDGKVVTLVGSKLRVYDTVDWRPIKTLDLGVSWGQGYTFNSFSYVPRTHTLLIGGAWYFDPAATPGGPVHPQKEQLWNGQVWVWQPEEDIPGRSIQAYTAPSPRVGAGDVIAMAISPDGQQVATGTHTGSGTGVPSEQVTASVHITNLRDGRLLGAPLDGQDFGQQYGLTYTADGRYLLVGHEDPTTKAIHVIDATTLQVVDTVHGLTDIYDLTTDPTGRFFAAGTGNQVLVWSLPPAGPPSH